MHAPNILRNSTKPITMVCARLAWLYLEFWTFLFFFPLSSSYQNVSKCLLDSKVHTYRWSTDTPRKLQYYQYLKFWTHQFQASREQLMFLGKGKKNKTKKQNKLYNMIPKFTKFYEGNVPSVVYNIYCLLLILSFGVSSVVYNTKFCFCVFFGREVVFFLFLFFF